MTNEQDEKALGLALTAWLRSQSPDMDLAAIVLARQLGMIIGLSAKDRDHLLKGLEMFEGLIEDQALATWLAKNGQ